MIRSALRTVIGWMFSFPLRIFISYRRDDSQVQARSVYNDLCEAFGARHVFYDRRDINYGDAFARIIDANIAAVDVVVVLIGPHWATTSEGRRRIAEDKDYPRREIGSALRMGKRVMPVLVGGAALPDRTDLPDDVAPLLDCAVLSISDNELGKNANVLVDAIRDEEGTSTITKQRLNNWLRSVALAGAIAVLGAAWSGLFDVLTLDTKMANLTIWLADLVVPVQVREDVQIVAIDPQTERARGKTFLRDPAARRYTLDPKTRRDHAELIGKLAQAGARTVGFDIYIVTPSPADDAVLLAAISEARAAGTAVVFGAEQLDGDLPVLLPPLRDAVSAVGMLCVGVRGDYVNTVPLASQGAADPNTPARATGFALAVAYPGPATIDDVTQRVFVSGPQGIRAFRYSESERIGRRSRCSVGKEGDLVASVLYRGAPLASLRRSERRVAYEAVLSMDAASLRQRFKDKTVLVGLTMPEHDVFETFQGWSSEERHGLELHADATSALLGDRVLQPLHWLLQFATLASLAMLGSRISQWRQPGDGWRRAGALSGTLVACAAAAVAVCANSGILVNLTYPSAALLSGYVLATTAMRVLRNGHARPSVGLAT